MALARIQKNEPACWPTKNSLNLITNPRAANRGMVAFHFFLASRTCPLFEMTRKGWFGPPPPPPPHLIRSDPSSHGLVGRTLLTVLKREVAHSDDERVREPDKAGITENNDKDSEQADAQIEEDEDKPPPHVIRMLRLPQASDRIFQSFVNSVAETQQRLHEQQALSEGRSVAGPALLLRGRLDHFNRTSDKWRLLVKKASFKARKQLARNRRKRERFSLWASMAPPGKGSGGEPMEPPSREAGESCSLEVLAFNDSD